jgi:hypothetical protein
MSTKKKSESAAAGGSDSGTPKVDVTAIGKVLQQLARPAFAVVTTAIPIMITGTATVYHYWCKLPQNAILFICGSTTCFLGGQFPVLFAALQAAEYSGRQRVVEACQTLANEAITIVNESKKDDQLDDNKDGVADVKQMKDDDAAKFVARKFKLVLQKMNPQKVDEAFAALYGVWLSVAAVLSIQFARTVAMSLSIATFIRKPIDRYLVPVIMNATPTEYEKWIPIVTGWTTKAIGIYIGWKIQTVLSAFSSAISGGIMMTTAIYQAFTCRNISLGGLIPKDLSKSFFDEALSYAFAALGFYVQFRTSFTLPFPLNVILSPLSIAETYLRWSITNRGAAAPM